MGFDLEKRVAHELNRLEDDLARNPELKPARRLEQLRRIAEELKSRMLGGDSDVTPGKHTQLDHIVGTAMARMQATAARAQEQLGMLPWQQKNAGFDDYRARGLRDVIQALGRERVGLQRATLGSAEPQIASRVTRTTPRAGNQAGQAMWRVAERRAATLYRHAMDAGEVASEDPIVDEALARCGNGQPLPTPIRKQMEADLGISLARVRVHTDPVAIAAAKAVRAEAFTVGEDIFFGENRFAPDSREGQKLLAHELTHVVQAYQGRTSTGSGGFTVSQPGESLEREADAVAERIERRADRRAARALRPIDPMRMRLGSTRYSAAAAPISIVGPRAADTVGPRTIAPAPAVSAPAPGVQLMRRPVAANDPTRATTPREYQDQNQKGTQPTFQRLRDRGREEALRAQNRGTRVDPAQLAQDSNQVVQGALTDLQRDVNRVVNPGGAQTARDQGRQDGAKQKGFKKLATDLKKKALSESKNLLDVPAAAVAKKPAAPSDSETGLVKFKKISDWAKYMPADLPDTDPRERKRIQTLIEKKVGGDRKKAADALSKLASAQRSEAAAVRQMAPALVSQIKGAVTTALGTVSTAEGTHVAAVQAAIATEQGRVRAHAQQMLTQINTAHATALQSIQSANRDAQQRLTDGKTQALNQIQQARAAQLVAINAEYLIATGRMTEIGADKAREARELPSKVPLPYTGDKLEAAEKAARETAEEYAAAMPGEAAKVANDLRATKGQVDQQANQMADRQRDAVNQAYDQAKQAVDQATRQATQSANQLKQQTTQQVSSTASTTAQQLAAAGQQSVSAIRSAAQGARTGIQSAGDSAATGLQESVQQMAQGIETGATGLIRGARQIEAPDPLETVRQATEAAQQLTQGTQQAAAGFRQTVTGTTTSLNTQAQEAVQGMAQTAEGGKAQLTQAATGAITSLTGIADGAKQGLTSTAEGHQQSVSQTATGAANRMRGMADQLRDTYETMRTTLNTRLAEACNNALTQFGAVVPTAERAKILENAQRAADAVKPWWQRALAAVVQIVVAVAITIAVGALIGATGGLALVAVGLLAGALSTVGGQMAHNLVMGENIMHDITVRSVLAGAIGGAVTAGFGASLTSGLTAFGGATGKSLATTLATKGAGGWGGALLRTGAGVGGDVVGDVANQLVKDGRYQFSMQNLAQSIVTNGITQGRRYGDFEANVQRSIRSQVPSIDISTGRMNTPMGPRATGDAPGNYFGAQRNQAGQMGRLTVPPTTPTTPTGTGDGPTSGTRTNDGGGNNRVGANDNGQNNGGQNNGGQNGPTGQNNRGADTTTTNRTAANDNPDSRAPAANDNTVTPNRTTGADPANLAGGGDTTQNRTGNGDANRTGGGDQTPNRTAANDNPDSRAPADPNTPRRDAADPAQARNTDTETPRPTSDGGDTDGNQTRNAADGDGTDVQARGRNEGGDNPNNRRGDGPEQNRRGDGDDQNRRGDGDDGDDGDGGGAAAVPNRRGADGDGGDGGDPAARNAGPVNDAASDLADAGYPNATRPKGDEAANAIEGGGRPNGDALRDTDANQQGLRDLETVRNDPNLTPESKNNINRDVANQLRGEEPTGNLQRDVQQARTAEVARTGADGPGTTPRPTVDGPQGPQRPTADGPQGARQTGDGPGPRQTGDGPDGARRQGPVDANNPRDVLGMNHRDFANNPDAQRTLFDAAGGAVERMRAAGEEAVAGIPNAEVVSQRKRPDLDSFTQEVLAKQRLKNYESLGDMHDIIRGRISVDTGAEMGTVAQRLRERFAGSIVEVKPPREGYPRWHINVTDPATGLVHEWQVGTRSTTDFFERPTLQMPSTVTRFRGRPDFHDGVYKLLDRVRDPGVRQRHGLDDIKRDYTDIANETGQGQPRDYERRFNEMTERINGALRDIEAENPGYLDSVLTGGDPASGGGRRPPE